MSFRILRYADSPPSPPPASARPQRSGFECRVARYSCHASFRFKMRGYPDAAKRRRPGHRGPAVGGHNGAAQCKAEACATALAAARFIDSIKAFEQMRQRFGGYSRQRVLNIELPAARSNSHRDAYASAWIGITQGIEQQVFKQLHKARGTDLEDHAGCAVSRLLRRRLRQRQAQCDLLGPE